MTNTVKSYDKNIFFLSMIPLFLMIFFGFFNITRALSNIRDVSKLRDDVFGIIASYYEMNYLQQERLAGLVYQINQNEKNRIDLISHHGVDYQKLDSASLENIKNARFMILDNQLEAQKIMVTYSSMISKLVLTVLKTQEMEVGEKDLSIEIQNYKYFLQLSENFSMQEAYLYMILNNPSQREKIVYQLQFLRDNFKSLRDNLKTSLNGNAKTLLDSLLNSQEFKRVDNAIENVLENNEMLCSSEYLQNVSKVKDTFFVLNNYLVNNIDDLASKRYDKEINDLILIILISVGIVLFSLIFGHKLKNKILENINENMLDIAIKNKEIELLYEQMDKYVIFSNTDLNGIITYASQAFCDISGYSKTELIGKSHSLIRHPDMPQEAFADMWNTIKSGNTWKGEVKNKTKDGGFYWVYSRVSQLKNNKDEIIGYTSIRQDITQQKNAEELNKTVNNLLANANQGFMLFGKDLLVKNGCSKESFRILSQANIAGKNISDLLFANDPTRKDVFEFGIASIFSTDDKDSQEMILALLPNEHTIGQINFTINCKILDDNELMMILEDVTEKRTLEEKIELENKIQKMIVVIATRKYEFIELKNEFLVFANDIEKNISIFDSFENNFIHMTKILHTFKGLFAQEELVNITNAIHGLESLLLIMNKNNELNNDILIQTINNANLTTEFEKDLKFITEILGKDFLEADNIITVDEKNFKDFENELLLISQKNKISRKEILTLSLEFASLNKKSLKHMLSIYPTRVKNIAERLNKDIYDFSIQGDSSIMVQANYLFFVQSLVHIFRNMIDHGIESPVERAEAGKDPIGKITCAFYQNDDYLITIEISDDGRGIDSKLIKQKALEKGIFSKEKLETMSEEESFKILFENNFSTKDDTDILSGRGVGMHVVKNELDKIGGIFNIRTKIGEGTKFIFELPAKCDISINFEDDEKILSDQILVCANNILKDEFDINVIGFSQVNKIKILDYHTTVRLVSTQEMLVVFSLDNNILDKFVSFFAPEGTDISEFEGGLMTSITDEMLNTLVGRAMATFPPAYKNLELGSPMFIDKGALELIESNNLSYNYEISTNFGTISISSIFLN